MRTLFTSYLVANLVFEGLVAVSLAADALGYVLSAVPDSGVWSAAYSGAAIAIASTMFWVWPYRSNRAAVGIVLGILFTFHAAVSIALATQDGYATPTLIHGTMAALAVYLHLQRAKWCNQ